MWLGCSGVGTLTVLGLIPVHQCSKQQHWSINIYTKVWGGIHKISYLSLSPNFRILVITLG